MPRAHALAVAEFAALRLPRLGARVLEIVSHVRLASPLLPPKWQ